MKVVGIIVSLRVLNPCLSDLTAFYAFTTVLGSVSERASVCLCALSKTRSGQIRITSRISSYPAAAENMCSLMSERREEEMG